MNYTDYLFETEKWKDIKQVEENFSKRCKLVDGILLPKQLKMIEKETRKEIDRIVFDSNKHKWRKNDSQFFERIENQSHLLITIETNDNELFGFYLESIVNEASNNISDYNSYVFKFGSQTIQQHFNFDKTNAFKVFNENEDNLFSIGKNDVIIKKQHLKNNCYYKQTTFDSYENGDFIVSQSGMFQLKRLIVILLQLTDHEKDILREKRYDYHQLKNSINYQQFTKLEEWTSFKCCRILFDSNIHNWSEKTSEFNERIIGKKHLLFLIEDDKNEKFGYYLNTKLVEEYDEWIETDDKSFEFNIESKNNRLQQPIKFEINDPMLGGYYLYDKTNELGKLISLGDVELFKEKNKKKSYCFQNNSVFKYHDIDKALCGRTGYWDRKVRGDTFTPKRILVIQMN